MTVTATPRVFPQGALTDVQRIMATPCTGTGPLSARSPQFAANWWNQANTLGHHLDTLWAELGFLAGNFGQPQSIGTLTAPPRLKVWTRPDLAGRFDKVPMVLPAAVGLARSPGEDHQGILWTPEGFYAFHGLIDATSGNAELVNRLEAELAAQINGRPAVMAYDAFAWSMTFTPWGSKGNATTNAPAVQILAVTPEEVATGHIGRAYTFTVDRRCSGNGPQAPHTGPNAVTDADDPRCWVKGGYGCSYAPAPDLETKASLHPVELMCPDGARLALQLTDDHIATTCKANGFKPGSPAYAAAVTMCANLAYSDEGHGAIQAQTGGAAIVPFDTSPAAVAQWAAMGFGPTSNVFRGLITGPDMIVCCGSPTSVDKAGKAWRREVAAVSTGY